MCLSLVCLLGGPGTKESPLLRTLYSSSVSSTSEITRRLGLGMGLGRGGTSSFGSCRTCTWVDPPSTRSSSHENFDCNFYFCSYSRVSYMVSGGPLFFWLLSDFTLLLVLFTVFSLLVMGAST